MWKATGTLPLQLLPRRLQSRRTVNKTGNKLRDREDLEINGNEDGMTTVTFIKVTEMIMVTINGVSPTLYNGVGNDAIEGEKVWSYKDNLHLLTHKASKVKVYIMMDSCI